MRISVIGAGYVGLTTAVGLASRGHKVFCIDTDRDKIELINRGKSPIYENGLEPEMVSTLNEKSFEAICDYQAITDTDITLICVGTPPNGDGSIDLSNVKDASRMTGEVLRNKKDYHAVVTRSTIIPGTTQNVIIPLLEKYSGKKAGESVGVAVSPEFMQEGKALQTFFNPDRIIVGEYDRRAGDMVMEINRGFNAPVLRTDVATAEMIKYASNAFLATKISFINEIGNICQRFGIDIYTVAKGVGYDCRIGERFLNAGVGFGGSCLPKDVQALVDSAKKMGYQPQLLESVLSINETQSRNIVDMAERKLGTLSGRHIAILGLSFKPDTDDMRNAPSIRVINRLLEKGALIRAHDPRAIDNARSILPREVVYYRNAREAVDGSDCVLILTEWKEYKDERLYEGKIVIDGRRALDPSKARLFCDYQGICW